ncbi:MAG TPA: nuclear transport factor 2 family protein [Jatrophihabitantaceae bacterium]|jgi:ketosteroid isomerase-like protein
MTGDFDERLAAWTRAERSGDSGALMELLHCDFLGVGPFGFVLTREEWAQRFSGGLHYTAFDFAPDRPIRYAGTAAILVGTQTQTGTHQSRPINGAFRVTLVFTGEPGWRLLGVHLSLRNPPGMSA